jgi:hypothetical protein
MGEVKYSKKANSVYLSEFIELLKGSISKTPKVKNHDQIVFMIPQLESILKNKGDVELKMTDLMKFVKK